MTDTLTTFAESFNRCWLCGTLAINTWPPKLQIHHIVRGSDREKAKNERCVLIRTCERCHSAHLDGMSVARQLALKKINDPEGYDRILVNRLRGRADDAVSEGEVIMEVYDLQAAAEATEWPYPKWHW
jgi:hypothetical protein